MASWKPTKKTDYCQTIDCFSQPDGKILLLKITVAQFLDYREITLVHP